MKKLFTLLVFLMTLTISAQAPQGFNYQATVRNNAGALMINKNVTFKFNVMKDTPTSVPTFSETHYVPTDDLGAVNLVIGKGTSTSGTFATIDWASGTYYLGIELNTGNGFVAMGTSQLLSVPYALYATKSGNETYQPWTVSQQKDSINFTKKVVIGNKNSVNVPPLTVIGTDSGPTSSTLVLNRSMLRNNVLGFETSETDNNFSASIGLIQSLGNTPNFFGMGVYNGVDWKNPFRIYYNNGSIKLGMHSIAGYSDGNFGGVNSISIGYDAKASGDFSSAFGYGTTSNSFMETAIGNFNTNYNPTGGITNYNLSDRLLVIGNGTSNSNRSNALVIKKSGEMSLEGNQIKNLEDPTEAQDAVTKQYVDLLQTQINNLQLQINNLQLQSTNNLITQYPVGSVFCASGPTQILPVLNPITGKTWMDRNLGASQVATNSTDALAYGDLYQWGRRADGHQCRTSPTTTVISSVEQPNYGDFILAPSPQNDWISPQNINLWQGLNGINNPCPTGYRIPSEIELNAERNSWTANTNLGAFASPLKLSISGTRSRQNGQIFDVGNFGIYWSSNISNNISRILGIGNDDAGINTNHRANGNSVRCIKN